MIPRHALFFALSLSCAAPLSDAGEDCLFNGDCNAPLVCAARHCRAPCRDDRDCVNNWRCRPSGQGVQRVCLPPEEHGYCATQSDCDAPSVCGPTGRCGSQCATPYDCRLYGGTSDCRATQQDSTLMLCTDNPNYQPVVAR